MILAQVILILILVIFKVAGLKVIIIDLLKGQSFTSEPVDGAGNELLLDILAELVVKLEAFFNIRSRVVLLGIIIIGGRLWGREEVEK